MKEQHYRITGMTCGGCVASVQQKLNDSPEVSSAAIQLDYPQASILHDETLNLARLKSLVASAGPYELLADEPSETSTIELPAKTAATYKPLILIVLFIAGISLLAQFPFEPFSAGLWMRHFMAGFFMVFAFFKLLDIKGFASSYRMYDLVAAAWPTWGLIYPFVELILGTLYLINIAPLATNLSTVIILGISSIGVIKSNLAKQEIRCACLGSVFNLPMSTVTIVEDLSMVAMALAMLFLA